MMKKVIFICLLSLSMCLSETNPQEGTKPQQQTSNAPIDSMTQAKPVEQAPTTVKNNSVSAPISNTTTSVINQTATNTEANSTETKPNATTPEKKDSATENKVPEEKKEELPKPPKDKNETKIDGNTENKSAGAATNGTTIDDKDKKKNETATTTTEKNITVKPTEIPKDVTEKPAVQARAFDGPSFIGGIILTLGLLAIGFMGFRYYKNQTERNYHTL